ncbi:BTAD domain-containing putative transcriptional regulator [Streptomyces sp. NPDC050658]|uniref:AfsR/SARP family transcriptional regulator n=1 Tax=unclassified Streptomyces TaxID=2593676 RepID=UPI003421FFCF
MAHEQAVGPVAGAGSITPSAEHVVGVRDGHSLAWDLARSRGLGLVGPGALDAVRALLISLLSEQYAAARRQTELVVPASDARLLLGNEIDPVRLRGLHIVTDLSEALPIMEAELVSRTRTQDERSDAEMGSRQEIILIASPESAEEGRLQSILDSGSALGLTCILIGQWRPGGTLRVQEDGSVSATSPSHADVFVGARLFTVPADAAQALLELLAEAAPVDVEEPNGRHTARTPAEVSDPTKPSHLHDRPLRISVFGRVRLTYIGTASTAEPADITDELAPRQREVLAYLALHPDGVRRETLTATLWPDAPHDRPSNSFHATLSHMRRALRRTTEGDVNEIVHRSDGLYGLDHQQVSVDLWEFRDAVKRARASGESEQSRQAYLLRAIALYGGDFADDVPSEWAEAPRETLRRECLDSVSTRVRALRGTDPREALNLLERARELDRYNEAIYRDIARMQAFMGEDDAVPRTFDLLRRALAEVDESPNRATVALFEELQNPPDGDTSDREMRT